MDMEEVKKKKIFKYSEIVSVLEQNNISWNGLVDGLVETYHNDNPDYKLRQNPTWWNVASKEEVIDSVISTFIKK
jgi:hypothetical protein